jgi:hypothetical protein
MGYFSTGWRRYLVAGLAGASVMLVLLAFGWIWFPRVPAPSATFDCDDSALTMYRHFQELGIEARPVIGNLEEDGETFSESDHVWLLVDVMGHEIAWDWGLPKFDRQHYEGYPITLDELYTAVAADKTGGASLIAAAR